PSHFQQEIPRFPRHDFSCCILPTLRPVSSRLNDALTPTILFQPKNHGENITLKPGAGAFWPFNDRHTITSVVPAKLIEFSLRFQPVEIEMIERKPLRLVVLQQCKSGAWNFLFDAKFF